MLKGPLRRVKLFIYPFFLALATLLFFFDGVLLKKGVSGAGNLYNDSLYRSVKPPEWRYSPLPLGDESIYLHFAPWDIYGARSIRGGEIPLWNPYSGAGVPFHANWQTTVFSPLKLPMYIYPSMGIFEYSLILRVFLCGLFMFVYCKKIELSNNSSLLASITYAFCGVTTTSFRFMQLNILVLLPLFFLSLHTLSHVATIKNMTLAGVSVALIILVGHPTVSFIILFGGCVFFLVSIFQKRPLSWKVFLLCSSFVLGFLLSSVMIFPFIELLFQGWTYHYVMALKGLSLSDAITKSSAFILPIPLSHFPFPYIAYCGIIPIALSLYHITSRERAIPLIVLLVIVLGEYLGIPPISWLNHLPPFSYIYPHYAMGLASLSLAVMAGKGYDSIIAKRDLRGLRWVGFALLFLCFLFVAITRFGIMSYSSETSVKDWVGVMVPHTIKSLLLSGIVLWVSFLRQIKWRMPHTLALIAFTFIDLFLTGFRYNSPSEFFDFPQTDAIRWLKNREGIFRIMGMEGSNNIPNTGMVHHLSDARIIEPIFLRRYHGYMQLLDPETFFPIGAIPKGIRSSQLLDLLNVKYILRCRCRVSIIENEDETIPQFVGPWKALPSLPEKSFRLSYSDTGLEIYENMSVFPRAFIVNKVILSKGEGESFLLLKKRGVDIRKFAILEVSDEKEREVVRRIIHSKPPPLSSEAEIALYEPHRIKIVARLSSPGVLILADAYYPGWKVFVDGREGKIYPTDYLFRGVLLEKGEHRIEFIYDPLFFKVGLSLSAVGVVFCLMSLLIKRRQLFSFPKRLSDK